MIAKSPTSAKTWKETLSRHVRWMLVIKSQRPALLSSYPLLFFNSLAIYFVAGICAVELPRPSIALVAATFLIRLSVGFAAARMLRLKPRIGVVVKGIFIADILLLTAFAKTLVTRTFAWRGRDLRIRSGKLEEYAKGR